MSVPYYPLVKGTKTYWIRKSTDFDAKPDGYVFVIPILKEGKTLLVSVTHQRIAR